jgi:hypothetical protein
MKTYKVIALSVGGKRNKVFASGDIVREKDFPEGAFPALVLNGFLEPIESEESPVLVIVDDQDEDEDPKKEGDPAEVKEEAPVIVNELEKKSSEESEVKKEEEELNPALEKLINSELPSIDEIESEEIKDHLSKSKISFGKNESKEQLYNKYIKSFK